MIQRRFSTSVRSSVWASSPAALSCFRDAAIELAARRVTSGSRPFLVFDIVTPLTGMDGGLAWLLTKREPYLDVPGEPWRLADAVANAARYAVGTGRPRPSSSSSARVPRTTASCGRIERSHPIRTAAEDQGTTLPQLLQHRWVNLRTREDLFELVDSLLAVRPWHAWPV